MLALLSPTAPSEYAEALYKSRQVDLEGERAISTVRKLLEETGLDERIGLDALGLLHRHFQTLTTQETRTHLHNDPNTHPQREGLTNDLPTDTVYTSLKCKAFRREERLFALSILATRA